MEKFKIIAKTLASLEEILAKEIEQLGGENIAIGNRMVSYLGDKRLLYKSNLWLRTALRVLKPIEQFNAADPDELYARVKAIDWSKYVAEGQTIAIDNTIYSENFRNSRFAIYRAKDAICDYFVEHGMKRPKVAVGSADVQFNLHIADTAEVETEGSVCTLSLDASGDPLYKRGYKEQLTDAPISEVLAAGILLKAGYDGTRDLYDPMCGSGTFLIEAALIATNTPAGLYRKGFGFQRWTVGDMAYDDEMWQELYDDDTQEREFLSHIYGSDISKMAIEVTTENVRKAGLQKYITLKVQDFEDVHAAPWATKDAEAKAEGEPTRGGIVIMNPPYGKRLFTNVPTFYKMVGDVLKRHFQGSEAWIISSDDPNATFTYTDPVRHTRKEGTPFDFVGLKPSLKIELNNGGIPCQLRKYELFSGKYDEFRRDGNELDKQSADQKEPAKRFERTRKEFGKHDGKRGDKPYGRDSKDGDRKKRFFDKDGKAYERGHKPAGKDKPMGKDKPARGKGGAERSYVIGKDGSISVRRDEQNERRREQHKEQRDNGNFRRGADGKLEERQGNYQPRGLRTFDPNRPMFREDFDMSKAVLDYTQPKTDAKPKTDTKDDGQQ